MLKRFTLGVFGGKNSTQGVRDVRNGGREQNDFVVARPAGLPVARATAVTAAREGRAVSSSALNRQEAEEMDIAVALSVSCQEVEVLARARLQEQGPVFHVPQPTSPRSDAQRDRDPTAVARDEAIGRFSEIVATCLASGEVFVDPSFVPAPKSLYMNGHCRRKDALRLACVQHFGHGQIDWLSAGQILQRPDDLQMDFESQEEMVGTMMQYARAVDWKVFQNDPASTDISQGGLGNCWFCGSLAAVAEKPRLIRQLFADPGSAEGLVSECNVYVIRLCDGGEWQYVIIDGLFPCNRNKMLAFSGARRNQLWVPLLEKAYAKLRGCYEAIEGGTPSEGLRLFTGWPSIVLKLQEDAESRSECDFEDLLWTKLVSAYESGLIICSSCGHVEGISDERYREAGLSPSHCYSICQVVSAREGSLRLLKLRNPWGTGRKWNGRFADSDQHWTPELQVEVQVHDLGAEGLFWMCLDDVRAYFSSITICPYREGWAEARQQAAFPETVVSGVQPAFLLTSPAPTELLLSLMQPEERASRTMMTADLGLMLFNIPRASLPKQGETLESLNNCTVADTVGRKVQDTLVADFSLAAGKDYEPSPVLAIPMSFNQRAPMSVHGPKSFTFAAFSPKPVVVRSLQISAVAFREALVERVRRGSKTQLFGGVRAYQSLDSGLTVVLENRSLETVIFEGSLTNIFNMTLSRPGDSELKLRDSVPPMHGMVIFVATAMPAGHNFVFDSKCRISGSCNVHEPPLAEPDVLHSPFFLEGATPALW